MNWRIIICVVGFLMGGCSLNIPLEDQFSDPDAITDVLSARSLLASAYEGLPQHLFEYSVPEIAVFADGVGEVFLIAF